MEYKSYKYCTSRMPRHGDTDTDTDTAIRRYAGFSKTRIRGYVCIYIHISDFYTRMRINTP